MRTAVRAGLLLSGSALASMVASNWSHAQTELPEVKVTAPKEDAEAGAEENRRAQTGAKDGRSASPGRNTGAPASLAGTGCGAGGGERDAAKPGPGSENYQQHNATARCDDLRNHPASHREPAGRD